MVTRLMGQASLRASSLDRIAVGVGPGSFTGLRVGIALAKGIALGADVPLFGVGSLLAMAHAAPRSVAGLRCPLLDARRSEIFAAVYDEGLEEIVSPCTLPRQAALSVLGMLCPAEKLLLGELAELTDGFRSPRTDLPDARDVAHVAAHLPIERQGAEPAYVREADAVLPELPRSPLSDPRR
jgi:tRNA threonylcarbamoyl adenosine modification protein YeaZ